MGKVCFYANHSTEASRMSSLSLSLSLSFPPTADAIARHYQPGNNTIVVVSNYSR